MARNKTNTQEVANEVLESSIDTPMTNDVVTSIEVHPILLIPNQGVTKNEGRSWADLITQYKTKSGVIRGLSSEGLDTKTIYKTLKDLNVTNGSGTNPIRYQHVRNVLVTPIKKS